MAYLLSGTRFGLTSPGRRLLRVAPELPKPDIRPQLRELLAWHEDVLQRIASGGYTVVGLSQISLVEPS